MRIEKMYVLRCHRSRRKPFAKHMLRTFFEKTEEDTSVYFRDKKIWGCGAYYQGFQGKYPVIFITFKDIKFESWKDTLENIAKIIQVEFGRHQELLQSSKCADYEKEYFRSILNGTAREGDLMRFLLML